MANIEKIYIKYLRILSNSKNLIYHVNKKLINRTVDMETLTFSDMNIENEILINRTMVGLDTYLAGYPILK